jgi:hypothetical protein
MTMINENQFPHVRALHTCLCCGGAKHVGLLLCWECHNELKMKYDYGYGPIVEKALADIEATNIRDQT